MLAEGLKERDRPSRRDAEDRSNPPVPLQGAGGVQDLQERQAQALQVSNSELVQKGAVLQSLSSNCALCHQLLGDPGKMNWQVSHKTEWCRVYSIARSEAQSLLATFVTPCRYCGSVARKSSDHCTMSCVISASCSSTSQTGWMDRAGGAETSGR